MIFIKRLLLRRDPMWVNSRKGPPSLNDYLVFEFWVATYGMFDYTLGGGGTPLYKLYRYLLPHRVGFLRRFDLKTGIHFAHGCVESGMVFEGTTGVFERIYRFNFK